MSQEIFLGLIGLTSIWLLVKLFILVLIFFYFVLAIVIVRQVDLMGQVVSTEVTPVLRTATLIHALAVGLLFLTAVILL